MSAMVPVILGLDDQPRDIGYWDTLGSPAGHLPGVLSIGLGGETVIDVGANVGEFTIWSILHGAGHVIAIEPFSENVDALRRNLDRLGMADRVTIVEAAVGPPGVEECEVEIRSDNDPIVRSTGVHTMPGLGCPSLDFESVMGTCQDLGLLKVDCEGAEYDFLCDADLTMVPYLTVELHAWTLPGDPPDPGLGRRESGPRPRPAELRSHIERTHHTEDFGGYVVGWRK